jgi:monoamine oxidase
MDAEQFDVLVIGAGASGLMAAWELIQAGKSVAIIEARNRIGGRIHTLGDSRFERPVELGAEFVHGKVKITQDLLKKANAHPYRVTGEVWQSQKEKLERQEDFIEDYTKLSKKFDEINQDMSVETFLSDYLKGNEFDELRKTLKNYVEGYYAADIKQASTLALKRELTTSDDEQYRVEEGYAPLITYLANQIKSKGGQLFLEQPVDRITWEPNDTNVITQANHYYSKKVLVTVPIGVLQSERIKFSPSVPEKMEAAKQLGFGPVVKTILQFDSMFWKEKEWVHNDMSKLSFIFSEAIIPTWWTQYPKEAAMLVGWSAGRHANAIKNLSNGDILQKALISLSEIFHIDLERLQKELKAWHVANWASDSFCCGGYSYEVIRGPEAQKILREPVENTLFFAGEGLYEGPEIGTVHAALLVGYQVAHQLIASY